MGVGAHRSAPWSLIRIGTSNMKEQRKRGLQLTSIWKTWSLHLLVCCFLGILAIIFQVFIHPTVTSDAWKEEVLDREFVQDHSFIETELLKDRWSLEDLNSYSAIARNRLVLYHKSSIRTKEIFPLENRQWEISLRWEDGRRRRPYRFSYNSSQSSTFALTFSELDRGRYFLEFEMDNPYGCCLYYEGPDARKALGDCTPLLYKKAIQTGPYTLTLRGENGSISALVDGFLCTSAIISLPLEKLMVALSTTASSCVAFDDIVVRVKKENSGWNSLLEEHFDANPFQTGWLDSRFDLDSMVSRITITWAALAAALLIDLAALGLFGRSSPKQVLVAVAVLQALAILSLQNILFLPLVPLLCCVGAVWASKALLSFFGRPQEVGQVLYRPSRILLALVIIAVFLAFVLVVISGEGGAEAIAILGSGSIAAMFVLLVGQWIEPKHKNRLLFLFTLCGIQGLHWFWFRKISIFVEYETVSLASLIPAILMLGLCMGAIRRPAWMRAAGRLLITALLAVGIELTIRSTPVQYLMDFEWRTRNTFWDLQGHTNLIVDHSKEELFKDAGLAVYSRKKPEGVFRIVCLGSSSTEGYGSEHPELGSYPSKLDLLLERCSPGPVEVINAGVGGYRLTQLRIYFEQILSGLDPDLLILYFGGNGDNASDQDHYKRVKALLEANSSLDYPDEVEAALSLRWPHPALVGAYLFMARSRLFMGMKLMADNLQQGNIEEEAGKFVFESADLLVRAALKIKSAVLLVPEITANRFTDYNFIFEELVHRYPKNPVYMLKIKGFDKASYLIDESHMNDAGYGELAGTIADFLIGSGLVRCRSNK